LQTAADFRPFRTNRDSIAHNRSVSLDQVTVFAPAFIGSASGQNEFFEGKIDNFCFYKRALTADEILKLATGTTSSNSNVDGLYIKKATFTETLVETQKNVSNAGSLTKEKIVALHRAIRNDFPQSTNDYILKHQQSPVEMMLSSAAQLLEKARGLEKWYAEYLPLTDDQWKFLTPEEREKWTKVKTNLAVINGASAAANTVNILYPAVLDMISVVEQRPYVTEAVAGYRDPQTPPAKDRTAEETQQLIEFDWLFQCDNKPTVERSLQEIQHARGLAKRFNGADCAAELKQLDELEKQLQGKTGEDQDLYFAVRKVKRAITFKNPTLNFDSLVFVDGPTPTGSEWQHETRHYLGYMAVPGARLLTLKGLKPDGHQTQLLPQQPLHGSFWRPDLSYDGKKVLVSFKPHNEKTFHLYEVNLEDNTSRQLTAGIFDDLDPIYLPDGKNIMFLTTRGHIYVRCMPTTNAMVMARMQINDDKGQPLTSDEEMKKGLYIISRNGEPEYTPSVLDDGRVIYTRWEYTDKPLWRAQSLWTMNADGTQVQTFWGNQSVYPDLLKDARQIPGSERIMFTGAGHHNWYGGSIGIIDPGKGFNYPDGLTKVTQELPWVEVGNGPADGTEAMKESKTYHASGNYSGYYSPYPLSEKDFLASAFRNSGRGKPSKWVLMLMDTDGNRELVFEGEHHIWDAKPIRSRKVPQVAVDRVEWTTFENRDKPATGVIYSNNVYENAPPELKGKAKFLRFLSIEHKTYTSWSRRNYVSSGPEISMNQSEGVKKVIGTVPIEEDGSVSFTAPSGVALHFQLLDENQLALQTMKSFTGVLPGETRGCLGCHESMTRSPVTARTGKALTQAPKDIKPVPWEDITVGYERYVQPVLDKHCGKCHEDPNSPAFKKFNMTLRPGFLGFKEPYVTLMGRPTWGGASPEPKDANQIGGFGWADTILVESYNQRDVRAYQTYPAMTKLSYKSRLVNRMMSGQHHGIKVTGDDLLRVILWVDTMGPYYGAEEVRCMEDPLFQGKDWISQPPRVMTAPIVQRPGPFNPFFTDSAYDNPKVWQFNALPFGVKR
jgi:hypothetical protein